MTVLYLAHCKHIVVDYYKLEFALISYRIYFLKSEVFTVVKTHLVYLAMRCPEAKRHQANTRQSISIMNEQNKQKEGGNRIPKMRQHRKRRNLLNQQQIKEVLRSPNTLTPRTKKKSQKILPYMASLLINQSINQSSPRPFPETL